METHQFTKLNQHRLRRLATRSIKQEELQTHRINILRSRLAVLESALAQTSTTTQANLVAYAQSECLDLTTSLMTTLPRELRDIVYTYLFTDPQDRIDSSYFASTLDPVTGYYTFDPARWKTTHYPQHFWDVKFVGDLFVRELAEAYYRTSTFMFTDEEGLMSKFLNTDQLGLGFLPKSLVRKVEVHLNALSYDRESFAAYMYGAPKTAERLRAGLEGVFELKEGAKVGICLETEAKGRETEDEWVDKAKQILLQEGKREGMKKYKVRVVDDEGKACR